MVISGMSAIVALSLSLELLYGQARVGMEMYKDHSVREEWDPKGAELEVETDGVPPRLRTGARRRPPPLGHGCASMATD